MNQNDFQNEATHNSTDSQDVIALAKSYFELANAHASKGHWDDAIKAYKRAIELESYNPSFYNGIGLAMQQTNKLREAEQAFKQAINVKSDYLDAYRSLNTLYKEQERIVEADEIEKLYLKLLEKSKAKVVFPKKVNKQSNPLLESISNKEIARVFPSQPQSILASEISTSSPSSSVVDSTGTLTNDAYDAMKATNRSNGVALLIFGIINIIFQTLNTPLGALMLIMSVFWFFIQTVAMNVVFSTVLFWIAFINLLVLFNGEPKTVSDQIVGVIFILVAFVSGFNALKEFLNLRKQRLTSFHQTLGTSNISNDIFGSPRLAVSFPITGLFISLLSLGGFIVSALLLFLELTDTPNFWIFMLGFFLFMSPFGFGWGLASLLSNYKLKAISVIGMVASGLVVLGWYGLLNL